MEQHPVPQHIASYEFRLVGDMTLKQFGWLAGGAIIGLIFYSLPIIPMIKWSLVITSGFFGFAFAFVPIEERPLNIWVAAFFKAIYAPTIFTWQKVSLVPDYFQKSDRPKSTLPNQLPPVDPSQLNEYLRTLPGFKNDLDRQEDTSLKKLGLLFQSLGSLTPTTPVTFPKPIFTSSIPPLPDLPKTQAQDIFPQPPKSPPKPFTLPEAPTKSAGATVSATPGLNLPIPAKPTKPNILVGMVLGPNNELLQGTILEIRDKQGLPARALKTNKLGQFLIATPLENGIYEIEVEKPGFIFDIIKIEVKGDIIPPIEIKAKK